MKLFVWSGLVGPDAPEQGISFSAEDSWSPSNSSTQPFDIAFLKVDSDKAYEVAQKNGGEKLTEERSQAARDLSAVVGRDQEPAGLARPVWRQS